MSKNQTTEEKDENKNLPVLEHPAELMEVTESEAEMLQFLGDLEEWLSTPFVQPSAIAKEGIPFTIHKATRRWAKDIKDETKEVEQFLYLVSIEKDFFYQNKSLEAKAFNKGDWAVMSYTVNAIREKIHQKIKNTLEVGPIPNMTLRFVPTRKKGHSPSVTMCHVTAWRSLTQA